VIPEGPLLWYVNRGTGIVLVLLLTATVLLGIWSTRGEAGARVPRFVVQALHRNIGLLSTVMLGLHVVSAVLDEYVDIRWWQALVPWRLSYEPLWLAAGVIALDLLLAVTVTSLLRDRLAHRAWRAVHLSAYLAWAISLVHGLGIGTDSGEPWAQWTYGGGAALVVTATVLRLAADWQPQRHTRRRPLSGVGGGR